MSGLRCASLLIAAVIAAALGGSAVATTGGPAVFHGIRAAQHPRTKADRLDPSVVASVMSQNRLQQRVSHSRRGLLEPRSSRFLRQLPNGVRVYAVAATGQRLCALLERLPHPVLATNVKPGSPLSECTSPLTQTVPTMVIGFRAYKEPHRESPAVSWGITLDGVTAVSFTAGARVVTLLVKHNAWVYVGKYMAGKNVTVHFKDGRTKTLP
jgi:hypothetical protein